MLCICYRSLALWAKIDTLRAFKDAALTVVVLNDGFDDLSGIVFVVVFIVTDKRGASTHFIEESK